MSRCTAALLASALMGLLIGAEIDILGFVIKRYFSAQRYGALYGLLFAVFHLGGALGVYSVAILREAQGDYSMALTLMVGSCLVAGALFALLGPYRYRQMTAMAAGRADHPEMMANG